MSSVMKVDSITKSDGTSGVHIAGHVIQAIDSGAKIPLVTVQSTTFADTSMVSVAITPKFSTSKIYVIVTQTIQVWNNSAYATGRWRILRSIAGGSYSAVMQDTSTTNGNIFAYDYGGSGINVYSPMTYQFLDSPNTTSEVIYKTQIARGSNGGNRITSDGSNPGRMTLLEIAQ
tara:strand:+ start:613 stop:1134 length:522 start_codon:yes stop_codon:yes gene_type:complete